MKIPSPRFGAIALVVMVLLGSRRVSAQTTLTFDANACSGLPHSGNVIVNASYIESNFQLTSPAPYAYWCSGDDSYPGSPAIYTSGNSAVETLSKVGGGTFALNSIDLADLLNSAYDGRAGSVLFTGHLFGGGTVQATGTWGAATPNPTFSTYSFGSGWTNLVEVEFAQGSILGPLYQFDNIVLDRGTANVIPEPATMTLLATGLAGMVGAGMRRRKKA